MPEHQDRPLRVFLCHGSGDKPAVRDLYKRLIAEGVDAWLDQEKLLPGQDWRVEIPRAVWESDIIIICLSNKSITKDGHIQKEIKFALDSAAEKPDGIIFFIPVRLEDCAVPERFDRWQWVDLFEENGFLRLLRSLKLRADKIGATLEPLGGEGENREDVYKKSENLFPQGNWEESHSMQTEPTSLDVKKRSELTSTNASQFLRASKQVFISYSRKDVDFANKINKDLNRYQMKTWIDQLGIRSGDDWPDRIAKAILESKAVLFIVSPSAFESTWVKREVSFADKNGKLILPLIYISCKLPYWFDLRFGNTQWADFTKGAYNGNLNDLLNSLKDLLSE